MDFDIAKGAVEAQSREVNAPSRINWNNFNFPPLIRLAHFSVSELHGRLKRFAVIIYVSFLLIFYVQLINCNFIT